MRKYVIIVVMAFVVISIGCLGGDPGSQVETGPQGPPGNTRIDKY